MKTRIPRLMRIAAVALPLALAGPAAFASDTCVTGCWTHEPCDGYCVDTGQLMGCGDLWAIIQECQPYGRTAQQEVCSASAASAEPAAANPSWLVAKKLGQE